MDLDASQLVEKVNLAISPPTDGLSYLATEPLNQKVLNKEHLG